MTHTEEVVLAVKGASGIAKPVKYASELVRAKLRHLAHGNPPGGGPARPKVHIAAVDQDCEPGTEFNAFFISDEGGDPVHVGGPYVKPSAELPHTPGASGHGRYYFKEYDTVLKQHGPDSPQATNNEQNALLGETGTVSMTTEYIHTDHLGSTRLVTDEAGLEIASYKYYPFGHYAETSSGSDVRMKFTGHERDEQLDLDYMFARYYGASLGRFFSADPITSVANLVSPQLWNRYAYAWNNPVVMVDPNGMLPIKKLSETDQAIIEDIRDNILARLFEDLGMRGAEQTLTRCDERGKEYSIEYYPDTYDHRGAPVNFTSDGGFHSDLDRSSVAWLDMGPGNPIFTAKAFIAAYVQFKFENAVRVSPVSSSGL